MKRISRYFVGGMLFSVLLLGVLSDPVLAKDPKPIELKAVAWVGLGRSLTKNVETAFAEMVKEKSNGQLTIKFLGGPEVIPKTEQVQACSDGLVDMVFAVCGEYRQVIPEVAALHLSPTTPWEDRKNGIYDYWLDLHKKYNLYYLGRWNYNMNFLIHLRDKEVKSISDLKGLKISPTGRTDLLIESLGAVSVEVGGRELYTAMDRGLLDGYVWSDSGHFGSWKEVTKYVLDHPFLSAATFTTVMNLDKFNALPGHLQEALKTASAEYEPIMAEYYAGLRNKERKEWESAGVKFIKLPPDDAETIIDTADGFAWDMVKEVVKPDAYGNLRKILLQQ
jgi:TRAP-type mannitol/chloroaromatic compound transport system substrate-binding protein